MKRRRLRAPSLVLLAGLLTGVLASAVCLADTSDGWRSPDKQSTSEKTQPVVNDSLILFQVTYQPYSATGLNHLATGMSIDTFQGQIFLYGFKWHHHVDNRWTISIDFQYGGDKVSGVYVDRSNPAAIKRYNRSMKFYLSTLGFSADYRALTWKGLTVSAGALLGSGPLYIYLHQDDGTYSWSDLSQQYTGDPSQTPGLNINTQVWRASFIAEMYLTLHQRILRNWSVEGTVGYHFDTIGMTSWMYNDEPLLGQGPQIDFNDPFVRIGVGYNF